MSNDRPPDESRKRKGLDGRMIGGRYEVTRTVAAGANTLIADAHDNELDRQVTIKLVRPELSESEAFRRTFRSQMEAIAAVSHPNLAAVYDWGEERIGRRGTVYSVVEYLSGGSLRDLFDRGRNLTPSQALMVGLEACRGLDFAHRQGFVHTELTPSKLVFGDDRRLRIVDFGLARTLGEQEWKEPARLATHVARYASPEQAQGQPLDGKTDVYSLALILVEAVTGSVPFMADSTVATLSARIGKLMPVSADLGPLASVLERAGRPEAGERASASQFGRALVRTAERMPRPTPIPILTTRFGEDPTNMRRPNDPTGGIARPPATAEPALVSSGELSVSPTDTTNEIAGGPDATARMSRSDLDLELEFPGDPSTEIATPAIGDRGAAPTEEATESADAVSGGPAPTAPEGDATINDELAALVERTPQQSPPSATRGAKAGEPGGRRSRRRATKAAKAEAKTEAKTAAKAAKAAKAAAKAMTPTQPAAPGAVTVADKTAPRAGIKRAPSPAVATAATSGSGVASPRRRRWVPWLVGLFLLGLLGGLGYIAWVLFQTPTHEIPLVVGLDEEQALAAVDDFEWDVNVGDGRSDEYPNPGEVIRTSPAAGEDLAEGSPLLLIVSVGPEFRQVPELTGMTLADATAEIERLRLTALEPTEEFSETVPAGVVISAGVAGVPVGGDVLPGAELDIFVSAGPQPRQVPQLPGLTVEDAAQLLGDLGLQLVVNETPVFDDVYAAGEVASQAPAPGTSIDRDATITVTVSKGPDLVTVPDLGGRSLPEIRQLLADAGLAVGNLLGSRQGTFVSASVGGEEIEGGAQVRRNSEIDIIIL